MQTLIKVQSLGSTSFDVPSSKIEHLPTPPPPLTPDPQGRELPLRNDLRVTLSNEDILDAATLIRAALSEASRS